LAARKKSSSIDDALLMIEKYPAAIIHHNESGQLPLHQECRVQCRPSIISRCIELYPESLAKADSGGCVLLHVLLKNTSSSIDLALLMIEKYPKALKHQNAQGHLPLHLECMNQCRSSILSKCIEIYPDAVDVRAIFLTIENITKCSFALKATVLSIIFSARPLSLYDRSSYIIDDIRADPFYRRGILNLLPRHVFTSTHESDYRDLNWQSRAAIMMLFSQIKIQQ
jgi:ankyrin repeat protein